MESVMLVEMSIYFANEGLYLYQKSKSKHFIFQEIYPDVAIDFGH